MLGWVYVEVPSRLLLQPQSEDALNGHVIASSVKMSVMNTARRDSLSRVGFANTIDSFVLETDTRP